MSVNTATINQQILTQQAAQQLQLPKQDKSTTWKPEGMPSGLSPSQQMNYAGQELYLFVDAIANSPSGVPTTDQTAGLAYFINQFVMASGFGNLDQDLTLFDNAYQTENAYIGQFINEANNPGGYGQIPT